MRVGVIGIGKVGSCMLAAFALKGHDVLGYDIRKNPLKYISKTEKDLSNLIDKFHLEKKIVPLEKLVTESDIIFIIVQTPSLPSGLFNTEYLENALRDATKINPNKLYIVSSTVPPNTMRRLLKYTENLYYNPLYIRLGSVISDLMKIKFILIGSKDGKIVHDLKGFYKTISIGQPYVSTFETVEITKIILNSIMTCNISLINKIGEIYKKSGADVEYLLQLLTEDYRFQLSSFRPGLGYGGPCLPRDNRMVQYYCKEIGVNGNIFKEIDSINNEQIIRALDICKPYNRIGIYGIGYKVGSDIIEDSQGWILVSKLKELGKKVEVYDPYNKELSTVATEHELASKTDIVILTLPYETKLKNCISLWG